MPLVYTHAPIGEPRALRFEHLEAKRMKQWKEPSEARDRANWEEVEEAVELLHEESYREALALLRIVLEKNPTNGYAFFFAGVALFEVGELGPSRDAYRACLKVAPTHLGARVSLTHVLRELGELREAIREGQEALRQSPDDSDALHALGLVYYARGEYQSARKYLEAFLARRPEYEVAVEVGELLRSITPGGTTGDEA